jgi:small subunit ribosomal protein S14
MARLSIILREQKRRKAVAKFAGKRKALFEIINDARASDEARAEARARLERLRNRCALTGRPRGFYRKFGLGRNKLREIAMRGEIPGLTKSSW